MAKGIGHLILIIKAILTRVIFATHGFIAIWRVTSIKNDPYYWYLCASILALAFEGIFTLTIKKNQEWKWFCPSVFFYLCSVVPAIWLLEVDKFDKKLALISQAGLNLTGIKISNEELAAISTFGVELKIPVQLDSETWATVIEQLLMLILIIGRWMLPKGGLTRDQLSQLLLVYIGTAADIIEFFDSFKDDKVASQRVLCLLILSIWSWSLLQFTFVLTATKSRRTRLTADIDPPKPKFVNGIYKVKEVCCSIDVWGILINIILQDAPFLIFRMLLITYYKIISYMNIFFTSKNTLVIVLQFYRLYVVQQEKNKELSKLAKATVSGNLAKAVERAAFMGPTSADPKIKSRHLAANKRGRSGGVHGKKALHTHSQAAAGAVGTQAVPQEKPKKHLSQESITSSTRRNERILEAARRERAKTGRRKSLSTGNLLEGVAQSEKFVGGKNSPICEDDVDVDVDVGLEMDVEMGIPNHSLSGGTNERDLEDLRDSLESEPPFDEISFTSEIPVLKRNKKRIGDKGVYKISGSRSTRSSGGSGCGSSDHVGGGGGGGRWKEDTGYSSSSRDSPNSSRRGGLVNGGGRTARPRSSGNRFRSAAQRREMMLARALNLEVGGLGFSFSESDISENERIFQRRAAICSVFSIFVVIFILCMVAIYGGINPKGLVLRETFRVANSTRPKTTTPTPTSTTTATATTPTSTTTTMPSNVYISTLFPTHTTTTTPTTTHLTLTMSTAIEVEGDIGTTTPTHLPTSVSLDGRGTDEDEFEMTTVTELSISMTFDVSRSIVDESKFNDIEATTPTTTVEKKSNPYEDEEEVFFLKNISRSQSKENPLLHELDNSDDSDSDSDSEDGFESVLGARIT